MALRYLDKESSNEFAALYGDCPGLPYVATDENNHRNSSLSQLNFSNAWFRYNAAQALGLKTASYFSASWFINNASLKMPAECTNPTKRSACSSTKASTASRLDTSHFSWVTLMDPSDASFWTSSQSDCCAGWILQDLDKNLISNVEVFL